MGCSLSLGFEELEESGSEQDRFQVVCQKWVNGKRKDDTTAAKLHSQHKCMYLTSPVTIKYYIKLYLRKIHCWICMLICTLIKTLIEYWNNKVNININLRNLHCKSNGLIYFISSYCFSYFIFKILMFCKQNLLF